MRKNYESLPIQLLTTWLLFGHANPFTLRAFYPTKRRESLIGFPLRSDPTMEINLHLAKKCWPLMKEKGVNEVMVCPVGPVVEVAGLVDAQG